KNPYLLHRVAMEGHHHLIELLLDAGVEIDRQTPDRRTPLQAAAYGGNPEAMMYLLHRGADVNAPQTWRRTSLHYAEKGKENVVRALLKYGNCQKIISAQDKDGYTPLHWNAHWGASAKITQMPFEHAANPNIQCK
ncbi:ankyrin, partial [Tuber magnatum]